MHPVNQLVDFVYGKEAQTDDVGAVARFIRAHVTMRPAMDDAPRWATIADMKYFAVNFSGVTSTQIDAAVTAAGV